MVVDHGGDQVAGALGAQVDHAAVGIDQAFVGSQCAYSAFVDCDFDEAVTARYVEGDFVAASQGHSAHAGGDDAFVAHFRREQGDVAALGGVEGAEVDDRTCTVSARKYVFAAGTTGQESRIRNAQGSSHQAAHVHLGTGTKQHAGRVGQKDLAVGSEATEDE